MFTQLTLGSYLKKLHLLFSHFILWLYYTISLCFLMTSMLLLPYRTPVLREHGVKCVEKCLIQIYTHTVFIGVVHVLFWVLGGLRAGSHWNYLDSARAILPPKHLNEPRITPDHTKSTACTTVQKCTAPNHMVLWHPVIWCRPTHHVCGVWGKIAKQKLQITIWWPGEPRIARGHPVFMSAETHCHVYRWDPQN